MDLQTSVHSIRQSGQYLTQSNPCGCLLTINFKVYTSVFREFVNLYVKIVILMCVCKILIYVISHMAYFKRVLIHILSII